MSRFGLRFSTDDVFTELVEGFPDDKSVPLVLLSLTPVFPFFLGDPSFDGDDDTRLGAIVNLNGGLEESRNRVIYIGRFHKRFCSYMMLCSQAVVKLRMARGLSTEMAKTNGSALLFRSFFLSLFACMYSESTFYPFDSTPIVTLTTNKDLLCQRIKCVEIMFLLVWEGPRLHSVHSWVYLPNTLGFQIAQRASARSLLGIP